MDESGSESDGRGVAHAQEELLRRRQDPVLRRYVCYSISNDFACLEAADLMEEKHLVAARRRMSGRRGSDLKLHVLD